MCGFAFVHAAEVEEAEVVVVPSSRRRRLSRSGGIRSGSSTPAADSTDLPLSAASEGNRVPRLRSGLEWSAYVKQVLRTILERKQIYVLRGCFWMVGLSPSKLGAFCTWFALVRIGSQQMPHEFELLSHNMLVLHSSQGTKGETLKGTLGGDYIRGT